MTADARDTLIQRTMIGLVLAWMGWVSVTLFGIQTSQHAMALQIVTIEANRYTTGDALRLLQDVNEIESRVDVLERGR
jgi:hypothetical protein